MKKVLSVILALVAVLTACSCVALAFDEENPNPLTGETQLKVAFNPLDKIHYTIIDEHADTGYYDEGETCEFTAEVWGGYEMTDFFALKCNNSFIAPYKTEGDVLYYKITVKEDCLIQAADGSVMEHVKLGLLESFIFWIEFIIDFIKGIFN